MSQIYHRHTLVELHGEEKAEELWGKTVNEVICQIGKGGGKDMSIRFAFAYIIYQLHCLRDPLAYYGKARGEYIDLLNIAINTDQAKNVFFEPLKNLLMGSPYFQEKGLEPRTHEIGFWSCPVRCLSGHSKAEGWEGYNLIACVLDEIAAFKTDAELGGEKNKYSASVLYNMARDSVISRFPELGKISLLSFPRYKDDFIQEKYDKAIDEKTTKMVKQVVGTFKGKKIEFEWEEDEIFSYTYPGVWALKCPSWYTNPTKTPRDYMAAYISNPIDAASKFFCMPPDAVDAYFRDPERVKMCFAKDKSKIPFNEDNQLKNWFNWRYDFDDPDGEIDDSPPRYVFIDLASQHDRAAVCMVHCTGFKTVTTMDGIEEIEQVMPVIRMDCIKYWEASANEEIDFNDIRQFVYELGKRFSIAYIGIDQWQSKETIRQFQKKGYNVEMHNIDKTDYDTLQSCIHDQRLDAYYHEILVDQELLKLQLIKGRKIDHPRVGYKDGSDTLAGAVRACTDLTEIDEDIEIVVLGKDGDREADEQPLSYIVMKKDDITRAKEMPEDLEDFIHRMRIF